MQNTGVFYAKIGLDPDLFLCYSYTNQSLNLESRNLTTGIPIFHKWC